MAELWEGIYVTVVLLAAFVVLLFDYAPPDMVMLATLALYMAPEIVTVQEALSGFSNSAVLSVAVLFVVAAGVAETGALDYVLGRILGSPRSLASAQIRLLVPTMALSAFTNNTPVVAILTPVVVSWCRKNRILPGKILMPLSFASILGGTLTLIGTSTNLVVAGLASDSGTGVSVALFDLAPYGAPVALFGLAYMLLFSESLLPGPRKRRECETPGHRCPKCGGTSDDYLYQTAVLNGSPIAGKTVAEAGLRGLGDLFLACVRRGDAVYPAVGSDFTILEEDILEFTGLPEQLGDLCQRLELRLLGHDDEPQWGQLPIMGDTAAPRDDAPVDRRRSSARAARRLQRHSLATPLGAPDAHRASTHDAPSAPPASAAAPQPHSLRAADRRLNASLGGAAARMGRQSMVLPRARGAGGASVLQTSQPGTATHPPGEVVSLTEVEVGAAPAAREGKRAGSWASVRRQMTVEEEAEAMARGAASAAVALASDFAQGGFKLMKAVLRDSSPLIGKSVKDVGFRTRFHATLISVRRGEERLKGGLGKVVLSGGDRLVMNVADDFDPEGEVVREHFRDVECVQNNSRDANKEFVIAMEVKKGSPLIAKTVDQAGLRGLPQTFLVAIERATGEAINAVGPEEVVLQGDVLWFAGDIEGVNSLRKLPGLEPHTDQVAKLQAGRLERFLVQAVVSPRSDLVGRTVRQSHFRTRFDAAIIAVHRHGERLREALGDVAFHAGDVLLLDTSKEFIRRHGADPGFALVAPIDNSAPPRMNKLGIASLACVAMIAVYASDVAELVTCALFAAAALLLTKTLSVAEARRAVKWDVIITIAAAFGISRALENSGVAKAIADTLVRGGEAMGVGDVSLYAAIYLATAVLSNVIANNAAAALMFPIAIEAAAQKGLEPRLMLFTIMLGASAAFMSPFGYQTNLMVYGAGGYTFRNFIVFGGPLQIVSAVAAIVTINLDELFYIPLIVAAVACVVIAGGRQGLDLVRAWWAGGSERLKSIAGISMRKLGLSSQELRRASRETPASGDSGSATASGGAGQRKSAGTPGSGNGTDTTEVAVV
ncbi:unnamed protein product [Pedinophyceae sp. YPF-701]|nr:unnamed protein product [Pedinophyceae sp. YPF-701]